jgi:uncharacterized paraquat-inducible protein A
MKYFEDNFLNPDDETYLDELRIKFLIDQEKKAKASANKKTRACLKCLELFESEGPHNRKCDKCRKEEGYER